MTRSSLNANLREIARTLSPTLDEQSDIKTIYASICDLLGVAKCIQIGSYPRYTAISPIHDLDILLCLGIWSDTQHDPQVALENLLKKIREEYQNTTKYSLETSIQNHSVTLVFKESGTEKFSVDIVPCYSFGVNSYGDPTYKVPEVIKLNNHEIRHAKTWNPSDSKEWINSDPRGYISQATSVGSNPDFRKAVKIVKLWKTSLRSNIDKDLKLKSFHLEQVITEQFQSQSDLDLIGSLFDFFKSLPTLITKPNAIEDRAQPGKYIDDYLQNLTYQQKVIISKAADNVLLMLEGIDTSKPAKDIFEAKLLERNPDEQYLFDLGFINCSDRNSNLAEIRCDDYANRSKLRKSNHHPNDEKLFFKLNNGTRIGYSYYWKVKNSDNLDPSNRRGEITLNTTKNYPETTKYEGLHYVECYAVNSKGECESKHYYEVTIGSTA